MESVPPANASQHRHPKVNFTRLVAALTGVNALLAFSSLITGPLQARALGPAGRGDLAAIVVPLTMAPILLDFGLTAYIVRARARGDSRGVLLGSLVPVSLAFSLIGVFGAIPFANLIAHGRGTVDTCLTIGLLMSPIWVIALTAQGIPWGEERWKIATFVRIAGPIVTAIAMTVLFVFDSLTVASGFIVFAGSSLVAIAPLLYLTVRSERWHFDRGIVRRGTRFGIRSWFGNLFTATDARLDQVLMAGIVTPRELGYYAVAVSAAGFPASFVSAISAAINPRVAQGNLELARRSCRVGLFVTTISMVAMAALVPLLLPLLFGSDFDQAIVLTWILLPSTMSGTVSGALMTALGAAGRPGTAARAQLLVLVPTIVALVVLLPSTEATGAAVIATVSSFLKCGTLLFEAREVLGGRVADYLLIRRADLRSISAAVRRRRAVA